MGKIEDLAEVFKAFSDPTRLRLVSLLNKASHPLCVNALSHKLKITPSAVSQHLRILRHAGLVEGERRGAFVHYSLREAGLDQFKALMGRTLGEDFMATEKSAGKKE